MPLADVHHVVVDGSNLATEGRSSPSLRQLDEAVRAYASEDPDASIIVVVDATFEHRVSDSERDEVRAAMLNGEIVSPPAGAIGRGDAFVLRIAERTGATVLSNDSFQEFHGEHPWLFSDGRLMGGKPVPGVGWIFTPRLPIRGPKSRAATAEARSAKDPDSAPAKAAELARAAKKAAKKAAKSSKKAAPGVDTSWPITPVTPPPGRAKLDPAFSSAIDEAVEEAMHPPQPGRARAAAKTQQAEKRSAPQRNAKATKDPGRGRTEGKPVPVAPVPSRTKKKRRVTPPPAVNEPLTFINFVAAFPVGSALEGEVVSFTSHGAMVDVTLPAGGTMHCYIPLNAMGSPPPTKAREVLKKGELRSFALAGLDPPRRVAELALAGSGAEDESASPRRLGRARGKGASAEVTATVKAGAKKSRPAKEPIAKREGVKKAAATTATAKKRPVNKAAAKKTAVTKGAKQAAKKNAATKKASAGKKAPEPAKKAAKAKARAPKRADKAKSA